MNERAANTERVYLSKHDAQALFGLDEYNAPRVLRSWQAVLTPDNHLTLYPQLRLMCTLTKVYWSYQSDDVRYMIRKLLDEMVDNIYRDVELVLPLADLAFMFPIVWQHRNLTDYRAVKKMAYKKELLEQTRHQLFKLGVLPGYQMGLF